MVYDDHAVLCAVQVRRRRRYGSRARSLALQRKDERALLRTDGRTSISQFRSDIMSERRRRCCGYGSGANTRSVVPLSGLSE